MSQSADPTMIFVGGLHRSGTSLLARMLAEHPSVSGLHDTGVPEDEGQHLQRVMPPASDLGGPGHFAMQPGAHLTEHDLDPTTAPHVRRELLDAWLPYTDRGATFVVEKSPPNLLRFRYLRSAFPDAHCILVVRHPVAVSHATEFWAKADTATLLEHWCTAHEVALADAAALGDVLVVRYEDLVADPTGVLSIVDTHCGLSAHSTSETVRTDTNVRYFRRFRHARLVPARVHIAPLVRRFERRIDALGFGYSLLDRGDQVPS
mgnify:FL=1